LFGNSIGSIDILGEGVVDGQLARQLSWRLAGIGVDGGVEGVEADAFLGGDLLVVGVGDQVQVGDPSRRCRCRLRCLGAGFSGGRGG
jgi:hypothetical protein